MIKLPLTLAVLLAMAAPASAAGDATLWERYKADFISADGRVIDFYQDQASHSEGQGYGMLMAAAFGDRKAFDSLWKWTKTNLGVRKDPLFAWKWGKRLNGRWEIIDVNNASDGDILIAYALLKAGAKWNDKQYTAEAAKIIQAVRTTLVAEFEGRLLLLPSYYGYIGKDSFSFNPSYLIMPAFKAFAKVDDNAFWNKLRDDGFYFISKSLFGEKALPADWVTVSRKGLSIDDDKSVVCGYEAMRVFLHLSIDDPKSLPDGAKELLRIYDGLGYAPAWVDIAKNSFSMQSASAGVYAILAITAEALGKKGTAENLLKDAAKKISNEKRSYYSFSLYLIATSGAMK